MMEYEKMLKADLVERCGDYNQIIEDLSLDNESFKLKIDEQYEHIEKLESRIAKTEASVQAYLALHPAPVANMVHGTYGDQLEKIAIEDVSDITKILYHIQYALTDTTQVTHYGFGR